MILIKIIITMRKKIFSTGKHSDIQSFGLLIGRLLFGGLMLTHGYAKLSGFSDMADSFADPFGLGSSISLGLTVFAEFFCALLVMIGLGTRLASLVLIINMSVALLHVHINDPLSKMEPALLFLTAFIMFLILGAGRYSVDRMIAK